MHEPGPPFPPIAEKAYGIDKMGHCGLSAGESQPRRTVQSDTHPEDCAWHAVAECRAGRSTSITGNPLGGCKGIPRR